MQRTTHVRLAAGQKVRKIAEQKAEAVGDRQAVHCTIYEKVKKRIKYLGIHVIREFSIYRKDADEVSLWFSTYVCRPIHVPSAILTFREDLVLNPGRKRRS